jgi:hypothetical protein
MSAAAHEFQPLRQVVENNGCPLPLVRGNLRKINMYDWHEIGALGDVPRLGSRVVKTTHGDVAIFRAADDQLFALRTAVRTRAGRCRKALCMATA